MKVANPYFEITNRCNLNCRDCYNASGWNRVTEELAPEVLEPFLLLLQSRYQVDFAHFSGGEPLLHSRFDEILDMTQRLKPMRFLFVTNGVRRHDRLYELLEQDPRYYVQFSIDGIDDVVHGRMRGAENFAKTLANLKSLKPIHPPVCKMILTPFNLHQAKDYFQFAQDLGCLPAFSFVLKQGNAVGNWEDMALSPQQKIALSTNLDQWKEEFGIKEHIQLPHPTMSCPLMKPEEAVGFCVKSNGEIMPCQGLYDSSFAVGSLHHLDMDLVETNIRSLGEQVARRAAKDFGCSRCINRDRCEKGCPAEAFLNLGDFAGADGGCAYRRLATAKLVMDTTRVGQE